VIGDGIQNIDKEREREKMRIERNGSEKGEETGWTGMYCRERDITVLCLPSPSSVVPLPISSSIPIFYFFKD